MRKFIGYLLVLGCIAFLAYLSPLIWALRDGLAVGMIVTTGADAAGHFLFLLMGAVLVLSPIWIVGVWQLYLERGARQKAVAVPSQDDPHVWPPPPNIPAP